MQAHVGHPTLPGHRELEAGDGTGPFRRGGRRLCQVPRGHVGLGGHAVGACRFVLGRGWTRAAIATAAANTWARPIGKVDARLALLHGGRFSPGIRAEHWGMFIVSGLPYPAAFFKPPRQARDHLARALGGLFPSRGWASPQLISALVHLVGVAGAVLDALAVVVLLRELGAGRCRAPTPAPAPCGRGAAAGLPLLWTATTLFGPARLEG